MSHLLYNGGRGTSNIIYQLLAAMTKMQVYNKMKIMMELESCDLISQPKFYVMWNESFDNYKIHKSSAFSKCDTCIFLKLQLQIKKGLKNGHLCLRIDQSTSRLNSLGKIFTMLLELEQRRILKIFFALFMIMIRWIRIKLGSRGMTR
jgi:hypothetical protein